MNNDLFKTAGTVLDIFNYMNYPKNFAIQYRNQAIPVHVVGDIQYLCFVARLPQEGEVHLCVDFEENGNHRWIEMPDKETERAYELGKNIQKQLEKEGYKFYREKV